MFCLFHRRSPPRRRPATRMKWSERVRTPCRFVRDANSRRPSTRVINWPLVALKIKALLIPHNRKRALCLERRTTPCNGPHHPRNRHLCHRHSISTAFTLTDRPQNGNLPLSVSIPTRSHCASAERTSMELPTISRSRNLGHHPFLADHRNRW